MDIQEAAKELKMHAYYQTGGDYELAWFKHISPVIKERFSFEEVMKYI